MTPRLLAAGDTALLVELGGAVHDLDARIAATPPAGVVETIPALRSLLVEYDPLRTSQARLRGDLLALLERTGQPRDAAAPRDHVIAVRYDGEDLDAVARACGLSTGEVARIHAAARYRVAMVGNMPGLPYLLGLDPRLAVPRRDDPRQSVPAGAVAIAGGLSCVYPAAGPGGWNLIGGTDAVLFDPLRDPPSLLMPGDTVRFEPRGSAPHVPRTAASRATAHHGPSLHVVAPGLLTTVQDAGRHGLQRIGVPPSGALDGELLRIANALVGNHPGDAALEVTHSGPLLEVHVHSVRIAIAGDVEVARIARDGTRTACAPWRSFVARIGERLQIGRVRSGLRGIVAVEGGIDVAPVLGSRSTCLRSHFGGLDGRAVQRGDALPLRSAYAGHHPDLHIPRDALSEFLGDDAPIRVVLGPQSDACTGDSIDALLHTQLTVAPRSDRTGLRLDGVTLRHRGPAEIVSDACAAGSVQVPGNGTPIVLLADRGTTGGYPKVATVASVDLPRLARLRPGATLRLEAIDVARAEQLRREREKALHRLLDAAEPGP